MAVRVWSRARGRGILLVVVSLVALAGSFRENLRDDYRHRVSEAEEQARNLTQAVAIEIAGALAEGADAGDRAEAASAMGTSLRLARLHDRLSGLSAVAGRDVVVFDDTGAVLFGPGNDGALAADVARLRAAAPAPGQATVVREPGEDRRFHVLFRFADRPVLVASAASTEAAETRWRHHAWHDGLILGAVSCLLLGVTALDSHRRRRSRRRLQATLRQQTAALARVNDRLVDAERLAHLGHWERDLITGAGYWSDENFRIYGLPVEQTSPELSRFLECIHPDDREAARRMREEVQAGRDAYELRCRAIRPDGSVRHVHSQAEVVRTADGRAVRLIGTTLDITDLVEAEQRLRDSEEKYRTVFEVGSEAICLIDQGTYAILEANRAARRLYGYDGEAFRSLTIFDLSAEPAATREVINSNARFVPFRRHRRKDGTEVHVELTMARAKLGHDTVLVMAVRDITERLAAAAQLAEAEARLIEAERVAHLGHWEWLPATHSQFWSEEMYRILGVDRAATGPGWPTLLDRLHPEDRAALADWPERGEAAAREVRVLRPDGEERRVDLTIQVTRDDDGAIVGLFGTALDVSDRHAAQRALRESHASLSAVINATEHDLVLLISPDGAVRVANDKVANLYDRTVPAIIGQRLESFMPPETARRRQALVDQVLASGTSIHLEETEAGLVFDTHCAPALGSDGATIGVAIFARNVTSRKTVENNLRKLTRAIEQTPLSVVITDLNGVIEYVNPHFTTVTGYTARDVVGRSPRILKSGYSSSNDYQAMWQAITAGEVWHGEFHNRRRDGSLFWERASIAPVRDDQGVITHYVAVKEDITQRKQVETELLAAKERAEAANIAKSQFLATVSHELRTPLNAIIGFSDCMRVAAFGPIGDERYQRYAGNIHDAGTHLLKLINDILDLARAEAGKFQLVETVVDPRTEILAAFEAIAEAASLHALAVTVDLPSNLPLLYADQRALRETVDALLSNAVKFTPQAGRISIHAAVDENGLFAIRVSDTGIGIPADQLDRVVQPFNQLDGDFTREHEGTGLGLALARSMAELHGGHLEIDSTPGVGTSVTVRFPRDRVLHPGDPGFSARLGLG